MLDMNGDGRVDVVDVQLVAARFNLTCDQVPPIPIVTSTPTPTGTPTNTPTATPTVTPWPTGDLWWTRYVHVYDASLGQTAGIAGALVTATAFTTDTCITDSYGDCYVRVIAHDTGSVRIDVSASGFQVFTANYAGLPPMTFIDIGLQPTASATPSPTPTATSPASAARP